MAENVPTGTTDNDETAGTGDTSGAEGVVSARDRFESRYRQVSDDVRRGAERASSEIRKGTERASSEIRKGAERAGSEIRRGTERASSEIRRGTERAKETYRDVADSAREGYDKVRVDAGNVSREVGFYVRDNPGKALLMAAGVGFLLGLVARGRGDYEDD